MCILPIDKMEFVWYYKYSQGAGCPTEWPSVGELLDPEKIFQRNLKNPLDKPPQVCYNKSTKGQGRPGGRSQNPLPHFRKKVLTNCFKCAIMNTERQRTAASDSLKKLSRNSKKALDKLLKMCYNKNVKRKTSYRIK